MKAEVLGEESCNVEAQSGGRLAWLQASSVALLMEVEGGCCGDVPDPDIDPFPDRANPGPDEIPDPATDPGTVPVPDPLNSGIPGVPMIPGTLSGESDWRLGSSWATDMMEGASTLTKTSLQLLWSVCSLLKCLLM